MNYGWYAGKHDTLARSKLEAGSRAFDVYAGVDVWARNCDYECGEGCKEAVEAAYTGGVSVGVFAGGDDGEEPRECGIFLKGTLP